MPKIKIPSVEMERVDGSFRTIYVTQPGWNFGPLRDVSERVTFLTTGLEYLEELPAALRQGLEGFDPDLDAIVCVGKVNLIFLVGFLIGLGTKSVTIGSYNDGVYTWHRVVFNANAKNGRSAKDGRNG